MYEYAARLERVVDADTLDVRVDLGFGVWVNQRIRLLGLNAPEKNTQEGKEAIAYVQAWLNDVGPELTLRTVLDRKEKYGRYLGTIVAGTRILNADLITDGHAVDYDGGRRTLPRQGEADPTLPVP